MTKFAFDLRGVIVDKETETITEEAIMSVRHTVEKFGKDNVYIISKAKNRWIKANHERLAKCNFFKKTGMLNSNLYFCDEYEDKQKLCSKLSIDYMVDDSRKVLKHLVGTPCIPFFFGVKKEQQERQEQQEQQEQDWVCLPTWKHFRKKIIKIQR